MFSFFKVYFVSIAFFFLCICCMLALRNKYAHLFTVLTVYFSLRNTSLEVSLAAFYLIIWQLLGAIGITYIFLHIFELSSIKYNNIGLGAKHYSEVFQELFWIITIFLKTNVNLESIFTWKDMKIGKLFNNWLKSNWKKMLQTISNFKLS